MTRGRELRDVVVIGAVLALRKSHGGLAAFLWGFVGPTVCYAFMQAVGMVNDHTTDCYRHAAVAQLGGSQQP